MPYNSTKYSNIDDKKNENLYKKGQYIHIKWI